MVARMWITVVLTLAFALSSGCAPARDQKQHNRGLDKPKPAKDVEEK